MTQAAAPHTSLANQIAAAASTAGISILASEPATSFAGDATTRFTLGLPATPGQTLQLEMSDAFDLSRPGFADELALYFGEVAHRLRSPRPATLLTLNGIPLSYSGFAWPFHESTAGADTSLVHGQIDLEDGTPSILHAKIAAALTVTFRDIIRAPEQPFSETFILNAVRKTVDQSQLELVKSGNRQPVPVTTRYFSSRYNKFVFNDTDEPQRRAFLAAKVFWLSGVLGAGAPVWLLDPRDAQYLNATVADLKISVESLAKEGIIVLSADPAYAAPTPALMARQPEYEAGLTHALAAIKPAFNEDMRSGNTNM